MKVLLTHERFLPDFGGGGEEIVFQTACHLRRRGADVRVLTTGDPRITEYADIPTKRLPIARQRLNLAAGAICHAARSADIIHTFNYHACLPSWIAGQWTGRPVVCTILGLFRDAWREMRGPLLGRGFAAWERLLVRIPYARTLFLSEHSRRDALDAGVPGLRALVNVPGIDPVFSSVPQEKDGSVLFAGKFEVRKGVHDVLAVARALPDVRFRLAGWGPEEEVIRRSAPANVEILGMLKAPELAEAYARAAVFLFPSRAETLGLVIAEAMASGCAIVSTIPLGYQGAQVEAGDIPGITRTLAALLHNPLQLVTMGNRNIELAQSYTWDCYADTLLRTYEEILREGER